MARAPYKTQSDTLKLQRLIEVLKERGSDLADNLETKAKDFLNDVKQKRPAPIIDNIPHYDSDASSGGSSFGKRADSDDDDDWGSDWEEWEEVEAPPEGPTDASPPDKYKSCVELQKGIIVKLSINVREWCF